MIHDADMVHGDLTTSNFMVREESAAPDGYELVSGRRYSFFSCLLARMQMDVSLSSQRVWDALGCHIQVAIDFGLGYTKPLAEDKAVDLYVLERAFVSTHPNSQSLVSRFAASTELDRVIFIPFPPPNEACMATSDRSWRLTEARFSCLAGSTGR